MSLVPALSQSPVEAARGVVSVLEQHRAEAEHDARMADAVRAAVGDAGLFVLTAPADCGGYDASLPDIWRSAEVLAEADPTVAWHVANSSLTGFASSRLSVETRRDIFADGRFPCGNGGAPVGRAVSVEGGYRLTGRWPFVTGIEHAQWNLLAALVVDPEASEDLGTPTVRYGTTAARVFLVPSSRLAIERTWDSASAMRGTGSHSFRVEDVFVEARFAPSWTDPPSLDRPLNLVTRPLGFGGIAASIAIGILRSAIDATQELGRAKSDLHGGLHGDQARFQYVISDAEATWRMLRLGWHELGDCVWDAALAGGIDTALRGRGFREMFHVLDTVRRTVSEVYSIATNVAYRTQNQVERALRDCHALAAASESIRPLQLDAARVMAGQPPLSPAF